MLKYLFIFIVIISIAGSKTFAQISDDGLSPLQRFQAGKKITGAFNAHNSLYCSQKGVQKFIPQLLSDDTIFGLSSFGSPISVNKQTSLISDIINRSFNLLLKGNDSQVAHKHICTGFYHEKNSHIGNASSLVQGYIIFDFRLFQHLNQLPDERRSMWIYDFIILHEFAHQLQYWNNDQETIKSLQKKQSAKKPELAADCLAGALIYLNNSHLSEEIFEEAFQGVIGATTELGDFDKNKQGHHGTPTERLFSASYGVGLGKTLINKSPTSKKLLNFCNDFVVNYFSQ